MLVRFLSYAASVIGARRYKPLLVSCLAVVFSITGIAIVASSISDGGNDQASRISEDTNTKGASQQPSTGTLDGLNKKQTKNGDSSSVIPDPNSTSTQPSDSTSPSSGSADGSSGVAGSMLEITVNSSTINLSSNSAEAAVTVASTATEASSLQWTITSATENGPAGTAPTVRIDPGKDSLGAVVRFRSDSSNAGTYRFTIVAKDAARQQQASKIVTVVVN